MPELYTTYAEWWPLLSAPEEYEEEAGAYAQILGDACATPPATVLELGSGGGNNAYYLKSRFHMTLSDLSPHMLAVSRTLNPECEHVQGDMRTLRLDRLFDAVFVHDAIMYMTTRADLAKAMETAFIHCRPGGAAVFVPDYTRETFRGATYHGGHDGAERSMRYLQWDHDPDPADSTFRVDFAFLLRTPDGRVQVARDEHVCGLFSRDEWTDTLAQTGFEPDSVTLETDEFESGFYRVFIGRKPQGRRI